MKTLVQVSVVFAILIQQGTCLQCNVCSSGISMDDCAASQKLKTCATDEDKCASLQEMYQGRIQYHKFCLHETINCKEVCTKYSSNGRKCSDKDIAECCQGDGCNVYFNNSAISTSPYLTCFIFALFSLLCYYF